MKNKLKACISHNKTTRSFNFVICISPLFLLVLFYYQSLFDSSSLLSVKRRNDNFDDSNVIETMVAKLRESVTFLPLKDLRFSSTAMTGNTWFMSSLNDTHEENESQYLYFPSEVSKGRILCIKGRDMRDGTKNSYALAWKESLPYNATLLSGLTYVSSTYYNYQNLWHGLCATAPFVGWTMRNKCVKPNRWVLYHWGELNIKTGSWVQQLMVATFGEMKLEVLDEVDVPYCFEKAVVMRHDLGSMGLDNKLKVFDMLRCKAREFCNLNVHRHCCISTRGAADKHAFHGSRQQCHGILSKRMVRECWSRAICSPLDGSSVGNETSGRLVGFYWTGLSIA